MFRGRKLISAEQGTRPTLTRIKESLFSIIADRISGSVVLDLFAGSGALGIECISRGAKMTYLVDKSSDAIKVIKRNTDRMNSFEIIQKDYLQALDYFKGKTKFDLVFIDPPYNSDMGEKSVEKIIKSGLLADDGLIIFEHLTEKYLQSIADLYIITRSKQYGDKTIDFIVEDK